MRLRLHPASTSMARAAFASGTALMYRSSSGKTCAQTISFLKIGSSLTHHLQIVPTIFPSCTENYHDEAVRASGADEQLAEYRHIKQYQANGKVGENTRGRETHSHEGKVSGIELNGKKPGKIACNEN